MSDELDNILDEVFAAGMQKAEQYRTGTGSNTLVSDTMYKAKQAIENYALSKQREARKDELEQALKNELHYASGKQNRKLADIPVNHLRNRLAALKEKEGEQTADDTH